MKYYRHIALAALLATGLALPALAQTAPAPDTTQTPKADTSAALPDAGVKKAAPAPVKHTHHTTHKTKTAKPAPARKTA